MFRRKIQGKKEKVILLQIKSAQGVVTGELDTADLVSLPPSIVDQCDPKSPDCDGSLLKKILMTNGKVYWANYKQS